MTRPIALMTAALAAALLATGCGSEKAPAPPKGPPSLRDHGTAVERVEQVESARGGLVAAENLYEFFHHPADARHQLGLARQTYSSMSPLLEGRRPVLDREIKASFSAVDALLAAEARVPRVNFRLDILRNQLLEAALDATSTQAARNDPTVAASALVHLATRLDASYAKSARLGRSDAGRHEFHTAYGLLARSQFLCRQIHDALGPQQKKACGPISTIRKRAFPYGVGRPRQTAPKPRVVRRKVLKSQAALTRRFGI